MQVKNSESDDSADELDTENDSEIYELIPLPTYFRCWAVLGCLLYTSNIFIYIICNFKVF